MRNLNEVREALLNSTVRIVAQYGLERTTTKLIAADAQINEAYIYRCYDSKDSLLQATFHMEDVCLAEHVRKSLPVMRIRGLNWKERCLMKSDRYFVLTQMWTCCCIRFLTRCFLLQPEYCLMRSRTAKIQRNGLLSRCTVSSAPMQEKIGWRQLTAKRN